ncbi:pirin-like protein-like protein Prn3 [Myriangium duriaei CBS 260.36]|uniref:Pirin-like protein-like protein Prn3 n=1 Tax=Myriangium duriaei CBS 260.36 TaxID=1168546 RepID=A0A9P4MN37_9PEZI|nr:pirin-like protein-like protein Prn3 [Myriangium duriaei CBS 260.36]
MRSYLHPILNLTIAIIAFYAKDQLQHRFSTLLSPVFHPKNTSSTMVTAAPKSTPFHGLPVIPPSLSSPSTTPRKIHKVFEAVEQAEGAGARVRRSVGSPQLRRLSPFLMLDHFSIAPGAGFPDHPHRGQETITYLLSGGVEHEDFAGHRGIIGPGDLQFMTAGRGIVHAEMPVENKDGSSNVGLQLWVDLPEKLKDCEPRYRDLKGEEVPLARSEDGKVEVKVISGRAYGTDSVADLAYTPVWLLDVTVRPGGTFAQPIPYRWNGFIYTLSGTATFGSSPDARVVGPYHNVVLEQEGDAVVVGVDAGADEEARFVLVAGSPLDQEIVQYGPFVGTKREDIHKAIFDYQSFANGFERAKGWESEIGKRMVM